MHKPLTLEAFNETVYREAEALGNNLFDNQFMVAFELWPQRCCYVSRHAENVFGYAGELIDFDLLQEAIHPDDLPFVLRASGLADEFTQFIRLSGTELPPALALPPTICFSIDYRLRSYSGVFLRVLRQNFVLAQDVTGQPLVAGSIFTDITGHKTTLDVRLSLDHPDFTRWLHTRKTATNDSLSGREQEVMVRMLVGESNADISKSLFISDLTLKTHRRNIHRKLRTDGNTQQAVFG